MSPKAWSPTCGSIGEVVRTFELRTHGESFAHQRQSFEGNWDTNPWSRFASWSLLSGCPLSHASVRNDIYDRHKSNRSRETMDWNSNAVVLSKPFLLKWVFPDSIVVKAAWWQSRKLRCCCWDAKCERQSAKFYFVNKSAKQLYKSVSTQPPCTPGEMKIYIPIKHLHDCW